MERVTIFKYLYTKITVVIRLTKTTKIPAKVTQFIITLILKKKIKEGGRPPSMKKIKHQQIKLLSLLL
jgi:hypothetical protein